MFKVIDKSLFSISTTTRPPRDGELDGVDYHFVSVDKFESDIKNGKFLEWAKVHNNYYGTSLETTKEALKSGKLIVFDIDVQGFESVFKSELEPFCTSVFVAPPDIASLKDRLDKRGTDSKDVIDIRIKNAIGELEYIPKYQFLIINDDIKRASKELIDIASCSKLKPKSYDLSKLRK
jgi:guanylate kinase